VVYVNTPKNQTDNLNNNTKHMKLSLVLVLKAHIIFSCHKNCYLYLVIFYKNAEIYFTFFFHYDIDLQLINSKKTNIVVLQVNFF